MRKDIKIDTVIGERMHVLAKTKFFEPLRDVFGYLDGSLQKGDGEEKDAQTQTCQRVYYPAQDAFCPQGCFAD